MIAIVPQIILRPTAETDVSFRIFVPAFFGFLVFVLSVAVLHQLNLVIPRKTSRKIVSDYLGVSMGVAQGAAQILAYAILGLLGIELVVGALRFIFPVDLHRAWLIPVLLIVTALPTLFTRPQWAPAVITWISHLTMILFALVIVIALVMEMLDAGIFGMEAASAASGNAGRYTLQAQVESFLAACLPAAAIIVLGERILVTPEYRRVRLRRSIKVFIPVMLLIALTLYASVILFHPYQLSVVPIMAISILILPNWAWHIVLVALVIIGLTLTISSYWQLPRILREMALENLLPRKLGVEDSINARRFIVLTIAALNAISSIFISTARSLAMIFILATYLTALITCLAMIARSQAILRVSLEAQERREAKRLRRIFGGYSVFLLLISLSFLVISVQWVIWTVLLMAGPVLVLGFYSFGRGRVTKALNVEDFLGNRAIPTKIHGVILLPSQLNEAALKAVDWAKAFRFASTQAIFVDIDPVRTRQLRNDWLDAEIPMSLTILGTPAGALRGPVIEYVQAFCKLHPHDPLTVIIPRVIGTNAFSQLISKLYTPRIISELRRESGVMILEVPYLIDTVSADSSDE